jgi:hypothetical protein
MIMVRRKREIGRHYGRGKEKYMKQERAVGTQK